MGGDRTILLYITTRLLRSIPTVVLVSIIAFAIGRIMPGDPVAQIMSNRGYDTDAEVSSNYPVEYARVSHQYGYDLPAFYLSVSSSSMMGLRLPTVKWHGLDNQYHGWVSRAISGDLGISTKTGEDVSTLIARAVGWSLSLALLSILLVCLLGVPLGILLYRRHLPWVEHVLFLVYSIPTFWLAIICIVFFTTAEYGSWTDLLPSPGLWDREASFWEGLTSHGRRLVIPLLVIVLHDLAYMSTIVKQKAVHESTKLYLLTAKSKGLSADQAARKHLLPNALLPIATLVIDAIPRSLAGLLIIEVICNIPGMGRLLYTSIREQDWQIVLGSLLLISIVTSVIYVLGDVLNKVINPKIQLS